MPVANSFGRHHVAINQPNDGRATDAEKVGRLLRRQRHGLRCDRHRPARVQRRNYLQQRPMNRFRQFDAVMLIGADKRITRPRRCAVAGARARTGTRILGELAVNHLDVARAELRCVRGRWHSSGYFGGDLTGDEDRGAGLGTRACAARHDVDGDVCWPRSAPADRSHSDCRHCRFAWCSGCLIRVDSNVVAPRPFGTWRVTQCGGTRRERCCCCGILPAGRACAFQCHGQRRKDLSRIFRGASRNV
jgi:hypothetical protein